MAASRWQSPSVHGNLDVLMSFGVILPLLDANSRNERVGSMPVDDGANVGRPHWDGRAERRHNRSSTPRPVFSVLWPLDAPGFEFLNHINNSAG